MAVEGARHVEGRCLWRAVSVQPGAGACPAARRLAPTRFLAEHAPALPLVDCDLPDDCECVFRHHADRRASTRPGVLRRRITDPAGGGRQ